ncbi:cytochrome P450 [Dactylonectria estremocensis]|uniref:Cytochrome P450 n=1 Tax=Dactylonectria estremocensis TaxID=1079267 RepID=A0A9P9J650_9HYPO|nr:cytochrome P450 [Dactylonectria estremocensis]
MTISFFAAKDTRVHRHLRSCLGEFADRGEVVPMDKWANYFTFDAVGKLAMGGNIGFLEQGKDVDSIIRLIHDGFYLMANMGNVSFQMLWFNNPLAKWAVRTFGGERLNAFDIFLEWLDKRVGERMTHGLKDEQRRDMFQHYSEVKDPQGLPVKKGNAMIEGVNILGAGANTTTIGILAILGSLLTDPQAKQKLQKEVDRVYQDLGLDQQHRQITFKDAERLPYLSAVIWESTRLHSSTQYQLPRYVPAGGVQIGTYYMPPGSVCGISPRSMNRSQDIFGPDADAFRPERWISQGPGYEERIKRQTNLLTTDCVGKNLATLEMYKYIAQFFRHFDAEVANPERPWNTKSQWFAFQWEFSINIIRRSH